MTTPHITTSDVESALTAAEFVRHLERATEIVHSWPEWKQRLLGGTPTAPAPTSGEIYQITPDNGSAGGVVDGPGISKWRPCRNVEDGRDRVDAAYKAGFAAGAASRQAAPVSGEKNVIQAIRKALTCAVEWYVKSVDQPSFRIRWEIPHAVSIKWFVENQLESALTLLNTADRGERTTSGGEDCPACEPGKGCNRYAQHTTSGGSGEEAIDAEARGLFGKLCDIASTHPGSGPKVEVIRRFLSDYRSRLFATQSPSAPDRTTRNPQPATTERTT